VVVQLFSLIEGHMCVGDGGSVGKAQVASRLLDTGTVDSEQPDASFVVQFVNVLSCGTCNGTKITKYQHLKLASGFYIVLAMFPLGAVSRIHLDGPLCR
jgi:hypothetical protein